MKWNTITCLARISNACYFFVIFNRKSCFWITVACLSILCSVDDAITITIVRFLNILNSRQITKFCYSWILATNYAKFQKEKNFQSLSLQLKKFKRWKFGVFANAYLKMFITLNLLTEFWIIRIHLKTPSGHRPIKYFLNKSKTDFFRWNAFRSNA